MQIPMVDLKGQFKELEAEIMAGLKEVCETTQFILGPRGKALEEEVAAYCGVKHAIGVASGTDALHLAVRAAGIGPGDEVITSPFTYIATAEAISYVGATPVYVDIDPQTFNLDIAKVEAAITERTKAVIPVHLFGQPVDLPALKALCDARKLLMIEDCAQSFGASCQGKQSGSWGLAGCYSFFPSKNLGCYGDGGMIVTDDDALAKEIQVLRNHGSRERYHHAVVGYNSRLDEMQAVVLRAKLKRIDDYNNRRRANAHRYSERLRDSAITPPFEDGIGVHVYHQYTALADNRDVLQKALGEAGIASAIYYPIPLHQQDVYAPVCQGVSLPVSENVASRCFSLPIYPELEIAQVDRVCDVLLEAVTTA